MIHLAKGTPCHPRQGTAVSLLGGRIHFMTSQHLEWAPAPDQPVLKAGDIHVWRVLLHTASAQAQKVRWMLAGDEINRAQGFYFSRDRDRFVTVRGFLRVLLGTYLQIPPERIKFHYGVRGKPTLASNQINTVLNFNVSHSHELALLAFTYNKAIGIDLEFIRPEIVREQVAERFFSTQETATLRALPDSLQPIAFFNCWTRKEAFIKATGEGLSRPLNQFSMSLTPGEPARLLDIQGQPEEPSNWLIQELDAGSDYRAALAVKKPVKQIHCWEYPKYIDSISRESKK
jgi:4'-phosphopantetheinyl transferase